MLKLMTRLFLSLVFSFFLVAGSSQSFKTVRLDEVVGLIESTNDTLYVVNFWATWCMPCVRELPYFEESGVTYQDHELRIILVNLDFKKDIEKKLIPFLEKYKLKSPVWFLDESNPNYFISKIEPDWSGAIPFTLFVKGSSGIKSWHEGSFTRQTLDEQIRNILFNH